MIIDSDNRLSFALESEYGFMFEDTKRAVTEIGLPGERRVAVSLRDFDEQLHLTAHLPQCIPGDDAHLLYHALMEPEYYDELTFNLWIDPADGELQYIEHLEADDLEHLSEAMERLRICVRRYWCLFDAFEESGKAEADEGWDDDEDEDDGIIDSFRSLAKQLRRWR